jgi:hypothetical protein
VDLFASGSKCVFLKNIGIYYAKNINESHLISSHVCEKRKKKKKKKKKKEEEEISELIIFFDFRISV